MRFGQPKKDGPVSGEDWDRQVWGGMPGCSPAQSKPTSPKAVPERSTRICECMRTRAVSPPAYGPARYFSWGSATLIGHFV